MRNNFSAERSVAPGFQPLIDAINDLTRVTLALHGDFSSRAETIRRLNELSIPASRIAAILAVPEKQVYSVLSKAKKGRTTKIFTEEIDDQLEENENA